MNRFSYDGPLDGLAKGAGVSRCRWCSRTPTHLEAQGAQWEVSPTG